MNRNLTLTLALIFVFVATAGILSVIMPGPHKPTDYLVIGGAATFLCLVLLFVALVMTPGRGANELPKNKREQDRTSAE